MKTKIILHLTKKEALSLIHAAMVGEVNMEKRFDRTFPGPEYEFGSASRYLTKDRVREVVNKLRFAVGKHWPRTGLP